MRFDVICSLVLGKPAKGPSAIGTDLTGKDGFEKMWLRAPCALRSHLRGYVCEQTDLPALQGVMEKRFFLKWAEPECGPHIQHVLQSSGCVRTVVLSGTCGV